jgi:hypothetical protein
VPFVRFSRDKRGYEHTYLVHESGGRNRPARARVLYWFRTPPGVKVGREPFDVEARKMIESRNPGMAFDWDAIASTPMPPVPEVEHWRERRRVERAAKVARREEEESEAAAIESADVLATPSSLTVAEPLPLASAADPPIGDERPVPPNQGSSEADPGVLKRRRRRGGRRRRPDAGPVHGIGVESGSGGGPVAEMAAESSPDPALANGPSAAAIGTPSSDREPHADVPNLRQPEASED